jgi:hypothetical protein
LSIETPSDRTGVICPDDFDTSPLLGSWRNTHIASRQIGRLRIEFVDERPLLNAWGVSRPSWRDWGKIPLGGLYLGNPAARQAAAFRAEYQFGPMRALLEANLSKGLLIIACMKTFGDGSGRSSYFVREFFRKTDDETRPVLVPADCGARPVTCDDDEAAGVSSPTGSHSLDPGVFLGRWENTDAETRGIRGVRISDRNGDLSLEIHSADGRHEADAGLFAEHVAGTAATQLHSFYYGRNELIIMHGWVKMGVLVLAVFRSQAGGSARAGWFDREFFYRADRP